MKGQVGHPNPYDRIQYNKQDASHHTASGSLGSETHVGICSGGRCPEDEAELFPDTSILRITHFDVATADESRPEVFDHSARNHRHWNQGEA